MDVIAYSSSHHRLTSCQDVCSSSRPNSCVFFFSCIPTLVSQHNLRLGLLLQLSLPVLIQGFCLSLSLSRTPSLPFQQSPLLYLFRTLQSLSSLFVWLTFCVHARCLWCCYWVYPYIKHGNKYLLDLVEHAKQCRHIVFKHRY